MIPREPEDSIPIGRAGVMLNSCLDIQLFPRPARANVLDGSTNRPTSATGFLCIALAISGVKNWVNFTFLILIFIFLRLEVCMSSAKRLLHCMFAFGQFDINSLE